MDCLLIFNVAMYLSSIIFYKEYENDNSFFETKKYINLFNFEVIFFLFNTDETTTRVIILNRGSIFAFQSREFSPPFKLRPQTPPIDNSDIDQWPPNSGHWSMSAQSRVTSRCDVAHSSRENLHHFFPFSCEACSLYLIL